MQQLFLIGKIGGAIMFVIGFILNYTIERRRFYRRSITGMQVYRSYAHSWLTRRIEPVLKLIAVMLIIVGVLVFIGSFMIPPRIIK